MRENNLLLNDARMKDSRSTIQRKRSHLIAGFVIAFALIAAVAVLCVVHFCPTAGNSQPQLTPLDYYRNHYQVDQASVLYDKHKVSFELVRDEQPDYEGDVVKPTSDNVELPRLKATITTESDHRMHLKISDADKSRWEVPIDTHEVSYDDQDFLLSFQHFGIRSTGLGLEMPRFSFALNDRDGPEGAQPIISTKETYFRYMEKYMVMELKLDSDRIFGLGERVSNLSLREGNYTLFSRDQGTPVETRQNPGNNLYGSQPFLLYQLRNGQFAGLYFKTSNALQATVHIGNENGGSTVRFSTIGGIMELYVFYKGSAQFILQQYHELVGRPTLPPMWALGYHHGRSGFKNIKDLKQLFHNFSSYALPLDSLWVDFETLDDGKNFLVNDKDFPGLKEFVEKDLHGSNIHFVPVVSPGLKADPDYYYYAESVKEKTLVRNASGDLFEGMTQVGKVGFPNFFNPKMQELWVTGVKAYTEATALDGLWMNLNEFSQLCDGECKNMPAGGPYDDLPFVPGNTSLEKGTLPMAADYSFGDKALDPFLREFNVHSMNSFMMAKATAQAFNGGAKRVFLASRSTFPGIQKFATAHWFGETESNWEQLKYSLSGVTNFHMFGLPLVGASVCGYKGVQSEELCARWMQLGLMYPLSLNLNFDPSASLFDFSSRTQSLIVNAIRTKYSLLRYIYTALFEQSLYGGAAIQPLFFEFPNDILAYRTSDRVLMYGKGLLVTTPLEKGQKSYTVYLPNANWYKFPTGELVMAAKEGALEGQLKQVAVNSEALNVFVRGGTILPYQDAVGLKVRNVQELNDSPMSLIIALDENGRAEGRMVVDDGISANTIGEKKYRHYSFTFNHKTLKVMLLEGYNYTPVNAFETFSSVQIWGATNLKNITSASIITTTMSRRSLEVHYDGARNVLTLTDPAKRKTNWKSVETVGVFADDDYNYCGGGFYASKVKITDQLRRMTALLGPQLDLSDRKYRMDAILMNDYVLNLKIGPTDWKAWEVPGIVDTKLRNTTSGKMAFAEYLFAISIEPDVFFFEVANPGDPEDTTITTEGMPMVLDEHFIEMTTLVKATEIYGLGERVYPQFALKNGIYTLYSRDASSPIEDGAAPGKNMYGTHPFYMFKMPDGAFAGVFLLSSNAMDISIMPFDETVYKIDHIITGGLIDMFIIQRGTPKLILEQYHNIIGRPQMLPYWAFGNHQSRYGYHTQEKLKEVVLQYEKAKLPLEALWTDIDYMDSLTPFTLDKSRYPTMPKFVNWLHQQNIKFIPIVEASIAVNMENKAYKMGLEKDVFIQRGTADGAFEKYKHVLGITWPGYSTFVDYIHPNATEYWTEMLEYMNSELFPFDGIWLDMNEATNFCDGECDLNGAQRRPLSSVNSLFTDLPYIPGHRNPQQKSIALDAQHYDLGQGGADAYIEYNMHSMYGYYETKATSEYFTKQGQRPFIISRSTFPGSGRYGYHWLGDNKSRWDFLAYSIIGIYNFNLFGMPFTGADVCGFAGNTTLELCQRWYQLAAFYPFCRNHNDLNTTAQEPYTDPSLAAVAGSALQLRYSLIRYMYTLHTMTAMNGGAYFMPLFYEFPDDNETYANTEKTFMLGPALKVSPVLTEGAQTINSYFPNVNWYSLSNGKKVLEHRSNKANGEYLTLDSALANNVINVHVRGGQIIPQQDTASNPAMTTNDLRDMATGFVVAPDHADAAEGTVIFDNDEDPNTIDNKAYKKFDLKYEKGKIAFNVSPAGVYDMAGAHRDGTLGNVRVFNAKEFQGVKYACVNLHTNQKIRIDAGYNAEYETLLLSPKSKADIAIDDIRSIIWNDEHVEC